MSVKVTDMVSAVDEMIRRVKALPKHEREAFARAVLQTLDANQKWDSLLAQSQDQLAAMAAIAMAEHRRGETRDLAAELE